MFSLNVLERVFSQLNVKKHPKTTLPIQILFGCQHVLTNHAFSFDIHLEQIMFTGEYNVIAGIDLFNLTCLSWQDEGFTNDTFSETEPLFYLFFLSYGEHDNNDDIEADYRRQLLYFDRKTMLKFII
jgi:hypothetical protein